MPILGNLSEFPLPEVLLLIGSRTGRLRLLDVPEFGIMDVDLSNGEVQTMVLGMESFTESDEMVEKLSAVVMAQAGMFEFRLQPVASVSRPQSLTVSHLVMSLVCYVDEQVALQRAYTSPDQRYVLAVPEPEIWIEPELNQFFLVARQFLTLGMSLPELAHHLEMEVGVVHMHLTHLRLLGLLQLVDVTDTAQIKELQLQESIARKSNEFLRASRAADGLKRMSGKLPSMKSQ